ncbi:MAG: O-antigen ligase family protein [Verrucomicrobiales bacterium]|nr:O-antigen ligase family protein [Verrucomicrobiales bacterium]
MDGERWDTWLERTIVTLIGAALAMGILAFGGVRVGDFLVVQALVGASAVVWMVRLATVRSHRVLWPPVAWGVVLAVGWAAWRTWEAELPYTAWGEWMRIVTYAALFFVVLNNLHSQDTTQGLAWGLIGLATLLCFYGAWQFASGDNTVWGLGRGPDFGRRASGSYANPNHFAGLLELLVPVGLAAVLAGRVKALGRVLLGYAVLVMLAGLVLSFSRGGWLAMAVGVAFVTWPLVRNRDYRWPAVICLVVLLAGASFLVLKNPFMRSRIEGSHDLNPEARNSRPHVWRAAWAMWQDHRTLGVGPAHFAERFKQYRTWRANGEPERAHNDYLDALADWGAAGTAVAALTWLLLGYGVVRTLRQVRRDPGDIEVKRSSRYAFVLGASAGLVALLVHAFVDFNFHIPGNALVVVTWMALLAGYGRYATDDWWLSSRRPWRFVVLLLVALPLVVLIGADLQRRWPETRLLNRAKVEPAASEAQLATLNAAWAKDSRNPWTAYQIGEVYRLRSFTGVKGYEAMAREALTWFDRAAALNPYQPAFRFRAGMCLDWLGEGERAGEKFREAHRVDPEGRITSFYLGWHELQRGDLVAARDWFTRSVTQGWPQYQPSLDYLRIVNERIAAAGAALPVKPSGTP